EARCRYIFLGASSTPCRRGNDPPTPGKNVFGFNVRIPIAASRREFVRKVVGEIDVPCSLMILLLTARVVAHVRPKSPTRIIVGSGYNPILSRVAILAKEVDARDKLDRAERFRNKPQLFDERVVMTPGENRTRERRKSWKNDIVEPLGNILVIVRPPL